MKQEWKNLSESTRTIIIVLLFIVLGLVFFPEPSMPDNCYYTSSMSTMGREVECE